MDELRAVLLPAPDQPGYDELPGSLAGRRALPPRFHIPQWVDTCTPHIWVCAVCWDEGSCTAWPCETALKHGGEVFAGERTALRFAAFLGGGIAREKAREEVRQMWQAAYGRDPS
jgi:hypothetical protein